MGNKVFLLKATEHHALCIFFPFLLFTICRETKIIFFHVMKPAFIEDGLIALVSIYAGELGGSSNDSKDVVLNYLNAYNV